MTYGLVFLEPQQSSTITPMSVATAGIFDMISIIPLFMMIMMMTMVMRMTEPAAIREVGRVGVAGYGVFRGMPPPPEFYEEKPYYVPTERQLPAGER